MGFASFVAKSKCLYIEFVKLKAIYKEIFVRIFEFGLNF